jgi:hypothetical protein
VSPPASIAAAANPLMICFVRCFIDFLPVEIDAEVPKVLDLSSWMFSALSIAPEAPHLVAMQQHRG